MQYDAEKFFAGYRSAFGPLDQEQVDGLNHLLASIRADSFMTDLRWAAYCLATTKHETADTFHPIDERGGDKYFNDRYGPGTAVGQRLGNKQPGDGARFHGRGFVQLTGRANFAKMSARLRAQYPDVVARVASELNQPFDLIAFPDQAKHPEVAYLIMSVGMREGAFTGKKLSNFIGEGYCDYLSARKIINGLDCAIKIEDMAQKFEQILRAALVE